MMPSTEIDASPTRFRWTMLGILLAISMVTYVDRVNVSVAASSVGKVLKAELARRLPVQ